ncbi:MAG: signal peptidase II, partial [Acidimicrobiia bacterium]
MSDRRPLAYGVAAALTLADVLTKRWAAANLVGAERVVIPRLLWFTYTENPGAAFSLFERAGPFLGLAAIVAVGVVASALNAPRRRLEGWALGLILGGALGNLVDRLFRGEGLLDGKVIDWIRIPNWPTFNLADSGITVGA